MAGMSHARRSLRLLAVGVTVLLAVPAIALSSRANPAPGHASGRPSPVGIFTLGAGGWQVESSSVAAQDGSQVSSPQFSPDGWLRVKPDDAGAPGTEIEALLQNGACPNVFYSNNMLKCFGFVLPVPQGGIPYMPAPRFSVPWWYRTQFTAMLGTGQYASLIVNGVVGQADVWVNGQEVATQAKVQGDYTRYSFDISGLVRNGANALALEVYPNDPGTMYTLNDVDWNQAPPDNNTGIQFPVQLDISNALSLANSHVLQADSPDLSRSAVTVKVDVTNHSSTPQTAVVSAFIGAPSPDTATIGVSQLVTVPANTTRTTVFNPSEYPSLVIEHPEVWWPYQMGGQPLYNLAVSLSEGSLPVETQSETFGIRTVTTSLVGKSAMAPEGAREFAVNGTPFLIRAGGWVPQIFLYYSSSDLSNQIALMKSLGINAVRLEGHDPGEDFYQQMDRAGILIDDGFQCCNAWGPPAGDVGLTAHDYAVMELSAYTIGQRLRNHPSVLNYSWSDNAPTPKQEQVSLRGFAQADFEDPIVCSAEYSTPTYNGCQTLPQSGEREGPYDWVPPSYWYDDHYQSADPTRTNSGGAWAFASEQSAGDTVPTMDSIQRFLSPSDQTQLWLDPAFNQYHTNYEPDFVSYQFGTLFWLDQAIRARYGDWTSLAQYVKEAQVQDYEDVRAQFEANIDHWVSRPTPATGVDYWQLNKGWPTLLWDLYNYDYDEAGSFFGAQKANEALHVLYALDTGTVTIDNLSRANEEGLSVVSRVYDTEGHLLDSQQSSGLTLSSQQVLTAALSPRVPAPTTPPEPARPYFIELELFQGDQEVDRNVYWLSTQPDEVEWNSTVTPGTPRANMTQYANLTTLQHLPSAGISVAAKTTSGGGTSTTQVMITNVSRTNAVAFFLRADVRQGNPRGTPLSGENEVLPVTWSDNDITLWPGESETLTASYATASLRGEAPIVSVTGWNVLPTVVSAAS